MSAAPDAPTLQQIAEQLSHAIGDCAAVDELDELPRATRALLSKRPFEDDGQTPSWEGDARRLISLTDVLREQLRSLQTLSEDIALMASELENKVAAEPPPVRFDDVDRIMGGSLSYLVLLSTPEHERNAAQLQEVIRLLGDGRDAKQIARWLQTYEWEPWSERVAPPRYDFAYGRDSSDPRRSGYVLSEEEVARELSGSRVRPAPLAVEGQPGAGKLALLCRFAKQRTTYGQLQADMLVHVDGETARQLRSLDVQGQTAQLEFYDGSSCRRPADGQVVAYRDNVLAYLPVEQIESGRPRYRLIGDGRGEIVLAAARREAAGGRADAAVSG